MASQQVMDPVGENGAGQHPRVAPARQSRSVAIAVAQFAIPGIVAVALIGILGVQVFRNTGKDEAIRDAKQLTNLAARGIVAPRLTPGALSGDPAARRALDRIVRTSVLNGPVVRVKIWDASGRILYSDMPALIGSRYQIGDDELHALRTGGTKAELSDLTRPENRFERHFGKLLEVYLGVRTPSGQRVLFEDYQRFSSVSASGQRLWRAFAPALIGALLLLELVQVPLAWTLARRLRRGQEQREALLRRAIDASDNERRRIARDLHDGVVQNLAGASFGVAAAAEEANDERSRAVLADAAAEMRNTIRALRTLLVDIYPPSLHREGLEPALSDLLAPSAGKLEASLDVPPGLQLPPEVEALLFRAAQETVRNVLAHADANRVAVHVRVDDGHAVLEVVDDGRGFEPSAARTGHFGLRMLGDLARDAGGSLAVESRAGEGTRVRLEVPVR